MPLHGRASPAISAIGTIVIMAVPGNKRQQKEPATATQRPRPMNRLRRKFFCRNWFRQTGVVSCRQVFGELRNRPPRQIVVGSGGPKYDRCYLSAGIATTA